MGHARHTLSHVSDIVKVEHSRTYKHQASHVATRALIVNTTVQA